MISKEDIKDLEIIDAVELGSDGTVVNLSLSLVSTTSGPKELLFAVNNYINFGDTRIEAGDIVTITGSTGADGTYTVASAPAENQVIVVESIATSTGGTATFKYPSGASKVGLSPTGLINTSATNLQTAVSNLDSVLSNHASQHYVGGLQPIIAQNLSSGTALAGKILQASGTGTWNLVDIVAGVPAELTYATSAALSTTTSATPVTKLTLTTPNLPLGDYVLFWSYITSGSANNTQVSSRIRKNGVTDVFLINNRVTVANAQFGNAGHKIELALSGVNSYVVSYWKTAGSGSAGIEQASLTLWLVDN
jgi:hypothetical protein